MALHVRKTLFIAAVVSALGVALGAAPAGAAEPGGKGEPLGRVGAADQRLLRAEAAAGAKVKANPVTARALAALQGRIANYVRTQGTKHSFGSFIDPTSGRIVVETDAPAGVVSALVGAVAGLDAAAVRVRRAPVSDTFSRKADITPYWGGNGVTASVGTPWCSTGFTVRNSAGARSMVTAGHCFANGTSVVTENGGLAMGAVSGNGLPSQDMELISGSSYGASIFVGGVDSSTGNAVVGAGDPVVGFADYCHSGRTTGENCGHTATSVTAQVCTSSGCKSPVIAFTGGISPAGGDSGSPFYVKSGTNVWARGIIIAGNGVTTYAEPWSRISARFGVSIVT
jgi:hypothetical protein